MSASIPADSAWLFLTWSAFLYSKDSQNLSFPRQPQLMRMNLVALRASSAAPVLWLMSKPACLRSRSRWCNEDSLDSFSRPDRSDAFLAAVPRDVVETTKNLVGQI
jgi:hypothetical protein